MRVTFLLSFAKLSIAAPKGIRILCGSQRKVFVNPPVR
jgi:hypothetical protein